MKEKLYTIPINDAFKEDCECPLCFIYTQLENNAIDFTLGPSYMEEDIRMRTDKEGFCEKHIHKLFKKQNSLGIANILKTHLYNRIRDIEKLSQETPIKSGLFKKNTLSPISEYIQKHNNSCYICNRITPSFDRCLTNITHLYKTDNSFRSTFISTKGFCIKHYEMLYTTALNNLTSSTMTNFINDLNKVTIDNLKRVDADLEWFIDKFDYRYKNEPWKNSKDAVERTIIKTNSTQV